MTHANKNPQDKRFYTRLISDDELHYVDTDYTIGELEETLKIVTNHAVIERDLGALKIASLFAFVTKQFEESVKERSFAQARFDAFREAVEEIQQLPSSDIKESLKSLLELDKAVIEILSSAGELL